MLNNAKVYGSLVDNETRCIHYHTFLDIIAIKFKCCEKYYPCYQCHNEHESHNIQRWSAEEFHKRRYFVEFVKMNSLFMNT